MALPSPTADFPDMSGAISAAQARARNLMNSAWSGFASIGQRPPEEAPQAPPTMGGIFPAGAAVPGASGAAGASGSGPVDSIKAYGQLPGGRDLLAKTIQGEAGGEGFDGMLAVGSVIGNRARLGRYGGSTIDDVIMAPGQFSMWNGVTGYAKGEGALDVQNLKATEDAYRAADMILSGNYKDPTGGATHYYNPSVATPVWGQQAGGDWTTMGNHIFGWADGRPGAHPPKKANG